MLPQASNPKEPAAYPELTFRTMRRRWWVTPAIHPSSCPASGGGLLFALQRMAVCESSFLKKPFFAMQCNAIEWWLFFFLFFFFFLKKGGERDKYLLLRKQCQWLVRCNAWRRVKMFFFCCCCFLERELTCSASALIFPSSRIDVASVPSGSDVRLLPLWDTIQREFWRSGLVCCTEKCRRSIEKNLKILLLFKIESWSLEKLCEWPRRTKKPEILRVSLINMVAVAPTGSRAEQSLMNRGTRHRVIDKVQKNGPNWIC